jgi:hypothetical protein
MARSSVLHFCRMSLTLTIRLSPELATWLAETAEKTGLPAGRIVRQQLERARAEEGSQRFLRHAGKIRGPKTLSQRKGFSGG